MPVYATQADYESSPYGATPAPGDITNRLTVASDDIDDLALSAVYDVDSAGMPTATAVIEAFKQATIAQAKHTIDRESQTARTATDVSIGSASVKYGSAVAVQPLGRFAPSALTLLRNAGVLPSGPYRAGG
jgi:hypothetical protein